MKHVPLGRTDLQVSELALGGAQFGQQYGPLDLHAATEIVTNAIDAGVTLIDTSAYYGQGQSETMLGEVLGGGLRERIVLCTKAGRLARDRFDFSAAGMQACFEASLKRLRTEHVDILLAHDIEFADDSEKVFTETAEVLHRLKAAGKARFIGMSALPLGLLKLAMERCQLDVVISYCHFHLQDETLHDRLLPTAQAHGVGVLNASPLAMGLLTNQGPQPWHPASADVKTACRKAAEHCHARGADISFLGMQFALQRGQAASTVTGAATVQELQTNLRALTEPLDEELLQEVHTLLQPVQNRTWKNGRWPEEHV